MLWNWFMPKRKITGVNIGRANLKSSSNFATPKPNDSFATIGLIMSVDEECCGQLKA